MHQATLGFLLKRDEGKILLAMKKRSFGVGKWNGFGGKLNEGESITQALIREAKEEINVDMKEGDLIQVATIDFYFENNPDWDQQVHVFFIEHWNDEPTESEEMKPEWFNIDSLPFENMWKDDVYWLPRVLKGEKVNAVINLNSSGDEVLDIKVEEMI